MLFNSVDFALFLPIVFILYWFATARRLRLQNFLIVVSSFVFYGWWNWRFVPLLLFSGVLDYSMALLIHSEPVQRKKRLWMVFSIVTNLSLLGFFKYYNFFVENFATAFTFLGKQISPSFIRIVLPVGISFYTFQTMSYVIDVYRKKLQPTRDMVAFLAYISFFAQLVAGPIERASHLLPQFLAHRVFDRQKAHAGLRQMLWGLFKKIVIADNCANYVNVAFTNSSGYSGSTLLLGAMLFAVQIYCDFSGYSDIAIGTGRLFGIQLMRNFAFPYFSRDIAEFWRRWHISLSTWFKDYVYLPLGGSQRGFWKNLSNIFIVFLLSGFWHGAKWTFVAWGFLNALYLVPLFFLHKNRTHLDIVAKDRALPTPKEALQMTITFFLAVIAWVFFRADSLHHAIQYLSGIASITLFSMPLPVQGSWIVLIVAFFAMEWIGRREQFAIEKVFEGSPRLIRWAFYYCVIASMLVWGSTEEQQFIYFQF
jgi:alginate O-acetyltransferase complex protein AlgI